METATRFRTVAVPDSIPMYVVTLQMLPLSSKDITKYASVSSGRKRTKRTRSAIASDTRNDAVGERSLPFPVHVKITTTLPITPIMNVAA